MKWTVARVQHATGSREPRRILTTPHIELSLSRTRYHARRVVCYTGALGRVTPFQGADALRDRTRDEDTTRPTHTTRRIRQGARQASEG